ncbi:hypothetical protein BC832DRAFT_542465 [Gaertneriomyces semiglobifer]|nr:hypothetical protein BC832DRAFT_542465 [Gaertneriomyces semiglobifer]
MDKVFSPRWSTNGQAGSANTGSLGNGSNRARTTTHGGGAFGTRSSTPSSHPRPRTVSTSSLAAFGTKDIVLGPGGTIGRPSSGNAQQYGSATASLSKDSSLVTSKRSERRERHAPANISLPPNPWRSASQSSTRQQPWPQLSSATLGSFKPMTASPLSETRPEIPPYEKPALKSAPIAFENNFPSLGNAVARNSVAPAATPPSKPKVAWGKPDVVSIVAAPPPRAEPAEENEEQQNDEEAAEIARLKALIPKLDKPKGKSVSMRERSKSISTKNATATARTFPKTAAAPRSNGSSKPVGSNGVPVMIKNRPKLRSTMKASPTAKSIFSTELEGRGEESLAIQGQDETENAEHGNNSQSRDDAEQHPESPNSVSASSTAAVEEEDVFLLEEVDTMRIPVMHDSTDASGASSPITPTSSGRTSPYFDVRTRSSSDSTSDDTVCGDAITIRRSNSKTDAYAETFRYSASLEKEEEFLKTLGWDKKEFYDSDLDEDEFIITEEEKEAFFKNYGHVIGLSDGIFGNGKSGFGLGKTALGVTVGRYTGY